MYYHFIKNYVTTLTLVASSQSTVMKNKQATFYTEVSRDPDDFWDSTYDIDDNAIVNLREGDIKKQDNERTSVFINYFYQYKLDDFEIGANNKGDAVFNKKRKPFITTQEEKWNLNRNTKTKKWYTNFQVDIQYNPTSKLKDKINKPKKSYKLMKRKRKTKGFDGSIDLGNIIYYHEKVGIPKATHIKQEETRRISNSRTVKERQTTIEDFPYAAGLIIKLKNGHTSIGGATLLSRDRLVTAGHCWKDEKDEAKELTVVLGSLTLFKGGTRIKTNKVVLHPYFQNTYNKLRNDIAIIKLDTKLEFSKYIQKVDLPYGSMLKESFVDAKAVIVGYGRQTEDQTIGKDQTLHHKMVQVIDNQRCQAVYLGKSVNERIVCAQSSTGTTCPGDSGSAMTIIRKNKSILIGVATFGTKYCEQRNPTGFVRVTSYMKFIEQHIGTN